MSPDIPRVLVPPRPNPGPEPWPESDGRPDGTGFVVVGLGLLAILLLGGRRLRRARKGRPDVLEMRPDRFGDTPRGRLVRLASDARLALSRRFGPVLRARTTEEIAGDVLLKDTLGPDRFESLTRLLVLADHSKFALALEEGPAGSSPEELEAWEVLVAALGRAGRNPDGRTPT